MLDDVFGNGSHVYKFHFFFELVKILNVFNP